MFFYVCFCFFFFSSRRRHTSWTGDWSSDVCSSDLDDAEVGERIRQRWQRVMPEVPLVLLESPFRSLVGPVLTYINAVQQRYPGRPVIVVLSEFVPRHFWEYPLHNQTALRLKAALFFRPNTVVVDVPYHLER